MFKQIAAKILRLCGRKRPYWADRRQYQYYRLALEMIRQYGEDARSVIDVGTLDSELLLELDWIPDKTAVDLEVCPRLSGVRNIQGDFMQYVPDRVFDLVLCLQVLEHLSDPHAFMQKLLLTGKTLIISVPFMWPAGLCKWHIQDPVTVGKLRHWSGRDWLSHRIVRDKDRKRLIAVYSGNMT